MTISTEGRAQNENKGELISKRSAGGHPKCPTVLTPSYLAFPFAYDASDNPFLREQSRTTRNIDTYVRMQKGPNAFRRCACFTHFLLVFFLVLLFWLLSIFTFSRLANGRFLSFTCKSANKKPCNQAIAQGSLFKGLRCTDEVGRTPRFSCACACHLWSKRRASSSAASRSLILHLCVFCSQV